MHYFVLGKNRTLLIVLLSMSVPKGIRTPQSATSSVKVELGNGSLEDIGPHSEGILTLVIKPSVMIKSLENVENYLDQIQAPLRWDPAHLGTINRKVFVWS